VFLNSETPNQTNRNFYNYLIPPQVTSISGYKINDVNQNGARDTGESGLSGWTINQLNSTGAVIRTTTTDSNGFYQFVEVPYGTYGLAEVLQSGWTATGGITQISNVVINIQTPIQINRNFYNYQSLPPPPPPPPPGATTIALSGSGSGTTGGGVAYDWSITKTPNPVAMELRRGEAKTVTYTITVTKGPAAGGGSQSAINGTVRVTNTGDSGTQNLVVSVKPQYMNGGGTWQDVPGASWTKTGESLASGASRDYSYTFSPVAGATAYQAIGTATITNYDGYSGTAHGPSAPHSITITSAGGGVVDDSAILTDVLGPVSIQGITATVVGGHGPWTFTASGTATFTVELRNVSAADEATATLPNTATLVEQTSGATRTADALVTIRTRARILPFTGGDPVTFYLVGALLVGIGLVLRKRSRRR
jgi:hypothetical protein